jgi:hypothetical protein
LLLRCYSLQKTKVCTLSYVSKFNADAMRRVTS